MVIIVAQVAVAYVTLYYCILNRKFDRVDVYGTTAQTKPHPRSSSLTASLQVGPYLHEAARLRRFRRNP
jgi:hypothetical protein